MSAVEVQVTDPRSPLENRRQLIVGLVALTKPRIIELLLVTTVPAMVLATRSWPGTWLVVATLIGGTLSAAGANAINNVIDRDIDAEMRRTAHRPMPNRQIEPGPALVFGVALGVGGFIWLWATTNLLAAGLASGALLFYVFVYTLYLKRTSTQNIVIGGAAGAVPALVGWAAVEGSLALTAWILFAIVFYWTPPHFWALSLRFRDDYARAGVPMLPVVRGEAVTVRNIWLYSLQLFAITLVLFPVAEMSLFYLIVTVALGGLLLVGAWRLRSRPFEAMRFFGYSNVYLTLLFGTIAIDALAF